MLLLMMMTVFKEDILAVVWLRSIDTPNELFGCSYLLTILVQIHIILIARASPVAKRWCSEHSDTLQWTRLNRFQESSYAGVDVVSAT